MNESDLIIKFWKKEAPATRKVISRIPEGKDYRPDPKSRNAREIAWLIVTEEMLLGDGLQTGLMEWKDMPTPATVREILSTYDTHHDQVTRKLEGLTPAQWERHVPFMFNGQEVMKETGLENAWGFLFDIVHHRGQLSTYLRAMGSTVPSIYGPSADEQS